MSATVISLPPATGDETVDFLRRMASMVSGRNGEMLMKAAATIEALGQRATSAEQLYHRQQEESTRNAELREVAELASERLLRQAEGLRTELAEAIAKGAQERADFDAERARLLGLTQSAEAQLTSTTAELEALKASVDHFNETLVAVPIEMLRLARAQFDYFSDGFARNGDVILQTMSEIGSFAIEQALAGKPEGRWG
jgi:chromosome segregation ATPase